MYYINEQNECYKARGWMCKDAACESWWAVMIVDDRMLILFGNICECLFYTLHGYWHKYT